MNQEVIRDFLNVPGIVGIALLSGHSQPVFYSRDPAFTQGQAELLSQGILQVVETIPPEYEVLEFRFAQNQIVLHRFAQNFVALVIKDDSRVNEQFAGAFQKLRAWIEANPTIALEQFQALPSAPSPKLKDLIDAFNQLNQFTTKYLGVAVITNYLKRSRPAMAWMEQFQITRSGQISFVGELSGLEQAVSAQEHEWFRSWVAQFIHRCSQAVRDYAVLVEQNALTDPQKALLLP
ncbi:MAG: hypothetical protein KME10_07550 [Plectolyngbya sp. WJT66-NPBG17]|jgi:hypothetical protein|nr:hypothetical protein [Plectolyngbya sp. WJT66-NPBG17]MBW4525351.1 hypothetical protein [Phormidium tanganyikae FI6-MK23]